MSSPHNWTTQYLPIGYNEISYDVGGALFTTNQDKRAVESMCGCELDLEDMLVSFPALDRDNVAAVYDAIRVKYSVVEVPMSNW